MKKLTGASTRPRWRPEPNLRARSGAEGRRRGIALGERSRKAWSDAEMPAFEASLGLPAIHRAQAGLISDMDFVADVIYGRAAKRAEHSRIA